MRAAAFRASSRSGKGIRNHEHDRDLALVAQSVEHRYRKPATTVRIRTRALFQRTGCSAVEHRTADAARAQASAGSIPAPSSVHARAIRQAICLPSRLSCGFEPRGVLLFFAPVVERQTQRAQTAPRKHESSSLSWRTFAIVRILSMPDVSKPRPSDR